MEWNVITCEFPPQIGGVADYTAQIADGLSKRGCKVRVFFPKALATPPESMFTFECHPTPNLKTLAGLRSVGRYLNTLPPGRILFVQYVPHGWGHHAMNLGFCAWVLWRCRIRGDDIRIMFHECALPLRVVPIRHLFQAIVHRLMAIILLLGARRAFVSTTSYSPFIARYSAGLQAPTWLPVPSNVPRENQAAEVERIRSALLPKMDGYELVIGHFGAFGGETGDLLLRSTLALLQNPRSYLLLIGYGATTFAQRIKATAPDQFDRCLVRENLNASDVSIHIQACDVMLQPYADGINARRSTAMASLANSVALVTNSGALTDEIWRKAPCAVVITDPDAAELARATIRVASDRHESRLIGERGRLFYEAHFSIRNAVDVLIPGSESTR